MAAAPTSIVIDPRSFRFFGKKWTEATVMGRDSASAFARYLVEHGVEFHHEPPTAAADTPVHRFLLGASPSEVERAVERALSPGREQAVPPGSAATTP